MLLAACCLGLSSLALRAATPTQNHGDRPNIVVIFSDDHARQAISAYGSKLIKTPGIDRLAREGVRFDNFYTSNPICAPSRATLLTGKYSHANGHRDNASRFDGSQQTFPKLLQAAGYETAWIGKWHLESAPQGFDHWEILPGQGAYYNPDFITTQGTRRESGYVTELISHKAIDWIDQPRTKPFCLIVGHKAPHRNWIPGPKQLTLFSGRDMPEPPDLRRSSEGLTMAATGVRMRVDWHMDPKYDLKIDFVPPRTDAEQKAAWEKAYAPEVAEYKARVAKGGDLMGANYQRFIKDYLRCVAGVDASVAEILDELDRKGLAKNTIVMYASDQGFFLGEFGWYDKRWFYEPSAGTPLLVRWPGQAKPRSKVAALTANVDLAPTILEAAGVKVPSDFQGRSLLPLFRGDASSFTDRAVYGHFYESRDYDHHAPKYVALRFGKYKLMHYYEVGDWELFDIDKDPKESRNLWGDKSRTALRKSLVQRLLDEQRRLKEDPVMIQMTEQALGSL